MNFDMRIACAFLLTSLCSSFCFGQELKFTTKFYDAVDKWVAFNKEEATQIFSSVERSIAHHKKEDFKDDSPYIVGFIYIDQMAGFTFRFEAFVTKTKNGLEKRTEVPDAMLIMRLNKNTYDVAVLSDKEIAQLGLPKEHSLLESYGKKIGPNEELIPYG